MLTSAEAILDRYFLEMRCKVLDLAASLDRVQRAAGDSAAWRSDPRIRGLQLALEVLASDTGDRAQRVQMIFSDAYDSAWQRPPITSAQGARR